MNSDDSDFAEYEARQETYIEDNILQYNSRQNSSDGFHSNISFNEDSGLSKSDADIHELVEELSSRKDVEQCHLKAYFGSLFSGISSMFGCCGGSQVSRGLEVDLYQDSQNQHIRSRLQAGGVLSIQ